MHEARTMSALLRRIEALARENDARSVSAVRVRLGALSHMSPEHFREHFEQASIGSVAEGARVEAEACEELYDLFLVDAELQR